MRRLRQTAILTSGLHGTVNNWQRHFSPEMIARFDYVMADAAVFTDRLQGGFKFNDLGQVTDVGLWAGVPERGRRLARDSQALTDEARLVSIVRSANAASKHFGDLRYWLTDFAETLLST